MFLIKVSEWSYNFTEQWETIIKTYEEQTKAEI